MITKKFKHIDFKDFEDEIISAGVEGKDCNFVLYESYILNVQKKTVVLLRSGNVSGVYIHFKDNFNKYVLSEDVDAANTLFDSLQNKIDIEFQKMCNDFDVDFEDEKQDEICDERKNNF